jgi:hypothetical protein
MWAQVMNFGHIPLFAVLASCLLGLCLSLFGENLPRHRLYVIALAWSLVLAGASETLQVFETRNVDAWDFLRNVVGAASALALWAGVDKRLEVGSAWPSWRIHLRLLAVAMVSCSLLPLGWTVESYRRMNRRVPVLFRFDSKLDLLFVRSREADVELVRAPTGWTEYEGHRVVRVTFRPARYPSVSTIEIYRDWEGYEYLEWDLFLEQDRDADLILRVHDFAHVGHHRDRFNEKVTVRPGPNRIRVSLAEIRRAPRDREMDMSAIQSLILFARRPEKTFSVYLAELRLVGGRSGSSGHGPEAP